MELNHEHNRVTYVKFHMSSVEGNEIRVDPADTPCDATCDNPFPTPDPVGYSCGARTTSNDKDFNTVACPYQPVRRAAPMPAIPPLKRYSLPSSAVPVPPASGVRQCHGRKTLSCAGGDTCAAPPVPPPPTTQPGATATTKPDNGLKQCQSFSDCDAGFRCYVGNCVRDSAPSCPLGIH